MAPTCLKSINFSISEMKLLCAFPLENLTACQRLPHSPPINSSKNKTIKNLSSIK